MDTVVGINLGRERFEAASFGLEFVRSEAFSALFEEGMELVEEAVAYLDGPGRAESERFTPQQAGAYTQESVQLTSHLMQITAWLLTQRALAEGTLSVREAAEERVRLRSMVNVGTDAALFDTLPDGFRALAGLAARLHTRVLHLQDLLLEADGILPAAGNPVAEQHWLLEKAFARVG